MPRPTAMDSPPTQTKVTAAHPAMSADDYYSGYTYSQGRNYYVQYQPTPPPAATPPPDCNPDPGWSCGGSSGGGYYYSGAGGGGSSDSPIPNSTSGCANAATVAENAQNTAEKQMHDHLTASIAQGQEWAGFTYSNNQTGAIVSIGQFYSMANGQAAGFPTGPPAYDGWTPVAWFHDHDTDFTTSDDPSGVEGPNQVPPGQPYSGNIFSATDEQYSNRNGLDGYVGIKNSDGNTWAEWTAGGVVGQQGSYTNKEGLQGGC